MVDFAGLGLFSNLGLFAVAAVVVWFAGTRLAEYAHQISKVTGLGQAIVGIVVLAGVTSLPEIAVTATASLAGDSVLAVNNIFGSIAMQVALLAIVDAVVGRDALTSVVPDPIVMLEGNLNMILITFAAMAMTVGDIAFLGAGLWSWSCLAGYLGCVWILSRSDGHRSWLAAYDGKVDSRLIRQQMEREDSAADPASNLMLAVKTAGVAAAILVAGFVLARTGGAIAEKSGLGQSLVGFVLVALATSLPELSAAIGAARQRLYAMAISDILGTNLINVGLVFLADILDSGEPIFNRVDRFAAAGALLCVMLTGVFMAGLSERRDKAWMRMGYDSIIVAVLYVAGIALLYTMRPV
ncbi:sodium:calcium antiporter [Microbaculum marinum]|uniref:Sodium:calcium antiporter n=1 Tax=Microbaculum marinum TaxID=1764581 RepID=A0AAW9RQU4_9HYPH